MSSRGANVIRPRTGVWAGVALDRWGREPARFGLLQHLGQAPVAQALAKQLRHFKGADVHHLGDHPTGVAQRLLGRLPPDQLGRHGAKQFQLLGAGGGNGRFEHRRAHGKPPDAKAPARAWKRRSARPRKCWRRCGCAGRPPSIPGRTRPMVEICEGSWHRQSRQVGSVDLARTQPPLPG